LPDCTEVREAGDAWIQSTKSLALRVPSANVNRESNVLINPDHPNIKDVTIIDVERLVLDQLLSGTTQLATPACRAKLG